jgi:hypothetical protein
VTNDPPSLIVILPIAALVAWRVYSRVRRHMGRQRLSPVRPWFTMVLFSGLLLTLAIGAFGRTTDLGALAAGVLIGVALGIYGLRLTVFEQTSEGFFYTPNAHLGIALSLVLVARVGYRLFNIYSNGIPAPSSPAGLAQSPLTLGIFGALAGYYVAYAVGLVRYRYRARAGVREGVLPIE